MDLTKKEAIDYLNIEENCFNNYFKNSREIRGFKRKPPHGWWYFKKSELDVWNERKKANTIFLDLEDYENCFEFALKVVYGGSSLGQRTEMQAVDNWITGRMAEYGFEKFMEERFDLKVFLDEEVHPSEITPKDIIFLEKNGIKDRT